MKDIYIKFKKLENSKKIEGESLDKDHKDWVEVTSWSQGIRMPTSATASTAGGHSAERCEHLPMMFTKDVDKASVYMWEACSAGYAYDVEIEFMRATGSERTTYLKIKLSDAIITYVQTNVASAGLPTEGFSFKYSKILWVYKGSKSDGTANIGNDVGGWDLATNKSAG